MLTIYRHAESVSNATGDYSIFDPPCTENGLSSLSPVDISDDAVIFTSSSTRAIQTGERLFPNRKFIITHLAREYMTGARANNVRKISELQSIYPQHDFSMCEDTIPCERTWSDGLVRGKELLMFLEAYRGEDIYVVSHGHFIQTFCSLFGDNRRHPKNGEGRQYSF